MRRKVIVIGLWLIIGIAAIVGFQKLIHEVDLRINGLTGEISSKLYCIDPACPDYDKDNPSIRLYLVLEKIKYSGKDWIVTKSITVRVKPSPEVDNVAEGQWVRVVKDNGGFWHLGKL